MTGHGFVLRMATVGAVVGFLALPALLLYLETTEYRRRLKEDVSRRKALTLYPRFLTWKVRELKPLATLKAWAATTAGGAVVMAVLAVFVVGLHGVVP